MYKVALCMPLQDLCFISMTAFVPWWTCVAVHETLAVTGGDDKHDPLCDEQC